MSTPAEFYKSLPPITKFFGTACLASTVACQIGILSPVFFALIYQLVFYHFQVHRLLTSFLFLGKFSINFGIRLLMIVRYGAQLESGPFKGRTADFLWMMIFGAFSLLVLSGILWTPFLGPSLVFMLLYVWSREFPNANINIYGLVNLKAFYLPWAMLVLDVLFGSEIVPDLIGIIAGHLYYFLAVLHPLATGRNILRTPQWLYPLNVGDIIYISTNCTSSLSLHVHTQALQACTHTLTSTPCRHCVLSSDQENKMVRLYCHIFLLSAKILLHLGFD